MVKALTPAQVIERGKIKKLVVDIIIDKLGVDDPKEQKLLTEERTLDEDSDTGLGIDSLERNEIIMEFERQLDGDFNLTDREEDIKSIGQLIDAAFEKSML